MSGVHLLPLTEDEYAAWADASTQAYAAQQVQAGLLTRVEAEAVAREQLALLLPQGLRTPSHHLWTARLDEAVVGHLWIQLRPRPDGAEAYILDVAVDASARGRGLGRATMLLAETHALALGARSMALNVFGHNLPARRLYDSLGYRPVRTTVVRDLVSGHASGASVGPLPGVRLDPLPGRAYAGYRDELLRRRAMALAAAEGLLPAEARTRAVQGLAGLLTRGMRTPGHALLAIRHDGTRVGALWLQLAEPPDSRAALGHDLVVERSHRRHGYGTAAVEAAVRTCADRGARTLEATLVGPEAATRGWLERLAFVPAAESMRKAVPG